MFKLSLDLVLGVDLVISKPKCGCKSCKAVKAFHTYLDRHGNEFTQ